MNNKPCTIKMCIIIKRVIFVVKGYTLIRFDINFRRYTHLAQNINLTDLKL